MVHGSFHDIIEEKDLLKEQEIFHKLNKQRHKHNVIQAVRRQQLPAIMEQSGLDFRDFSHHEREQQLHQWNHEDFGFRMLDALESIDEHVKNLLTDTRLKYVRKGQVYGNRFSLATGALYQIDIVHSENTVNPPPTLYNIATPRRPVPRVTLINEGPTPGILLANTNMDYNDQGQPSLAVPAPASNYYNSFVIDTGEPVIERLNFMASGGNIVVNIIFET